MFIIARGNVADGFAFEGPFLDHDTALEACEGEDSYWEIVPLNRPDEDSVLDTLEVVIDEARTIGKRVHFLSSHIDDETPPYVLKQKLKDCEASAKELLAFLDETQKDLPNNFKVGDKIKVNAGKYSGSVGEVTGFGDGSKVIVRLYDVSIKDIEIIASNLEIR